jgi:hypothetical protein
MPRYRLRLDCQRPYSVHHHLARQLRVRNCTGKGCQIMRSFQRPAAALVMSAAVFTGSLLAGTVSPASAAVPTAAAPMISVSGNSRAAVLLRTALDHVRRTSSGQFVLDPAGLSSRARRLDSALVADLNKLERQPWTPGLNTGNVVDTADVVPAADQDTTVITIVPGTTLTISSTEVMLDISAQDVTDIENAADLGSAIAELVGAILDLADVDNGDAIAEIVASSLDLGSDALKLCAGNDGGSLILSVSVPSDGLPSVSACGITV